jgi:hypothetical protein
VSSDARALNLARISEKVAAFKYNRYTAFSKFITAISLKKLRQNFSFKEK